MNRAHPAPVPGSNDRDLSNGAWGGTSDSGWSEDDLTEVYEGEVCKPDAMHGGNFEEWHVEVSSDPPSGSERRQMVSMGTTPKTLEVVAPTTAVGGEGGDREGGGGKQEQLALVAALLMAVPVAASASAAEAMKVRKPNTITKSRESWTEPEHAKFLEALELLKSMSLWWT